MRKHCFQKKMTKLEHFIWYVLMSANNELRCIANLLTRPFHWISFISGIKWTFKKCKRVVRSAFIDNFKIRFAFEPRKHKNRGK